MNIGLVIGKKTSTGTPGKNIRPILGRPAAEYAFIAAKYSNIDKTYVSTDCEVISGIGSGYGATVIHRSAELATPEALTEDVLLHAYNFIKLDLSDGTPIHSISLLFANNPAINVNLLNEALECVVGEAQTDLFFRIEVR
jgi:CMP-N-acetylneuraminic acid synthetase